MCEEINTQGIEFNTSHQLKRNTHTGWLLLQAAGWFGARLPALWGAQGRRVCSHGSLALGRGERNLAGLRPRIPSASCTPRPEKKKLLQVKIGTVKSSPFAVVSKAGSIISASRTAGPTHCPPACCLHPSALSEPPLLSPPQL